MTATRRKGARITVKPLAGLAFALFAVPVWAQVSPKPVLKEPLAAGKGREPKLEIVHRFEGTMPVGVAVTSTGRIFVSYPHWTDNGDTTPVFLTGAKTPLSGQSSETARVSPGL